MNADFKCRSRQKIVRRQLQCQFVTNEDIIQEDIPEPLPVMKNGKVVMGNTSGGNHKNKKGSFTYTLKSVKKLPGRTKYYTYSWQKKIHHSVGWINYITITRTFNRPQLVGKVINYFGRDFRIINKG